MADSTKGRRKRGKVGPGPKMRFAIPLTEAELNYIREQDMRAESGAEDPGLAFLKHAAEKKKPKKRKLRK